MVEWSRRRVPALVVFAVVATAAIAGVSGALVGARLGDDDVRSVFVYDSSGLSGDGAFDSWPELMEAVGRVEGVTPQIHFQQNETISAEGMPEGGWDLNGAEWFGGGMEFAVNEYLGVGRVTLADGVKFTGVPVRWLNDGLFVYSTSSEPVVEVDSSRPFYFTGNVTVAAQRAPVFRLSLTSGAVQFLLFNGSVLARPSVLQITDGDYEVIDITGTPENVTIQYISGQSGITDDTVRGRGDLNINVNASASELTGGIQSNLDGKVLTVRHTKAGAVGAEPEPGSDLDPTVQSELDRLGG